MVFFMAMTSEKSGQSQLSRDIIIVFEAFLIDLVMYNYQIITTYVSKVMHPPTYSLKSLMEFLANTPLVFPHLSFRFFTYKYNSPVVDFLYLENRGDVFAKELH